MTPEELQAIRERLADVSHDIWASWMKWQFSVCEPLPSGAMVIPAEKVKRWQRQIDTPYAELSEGEKDSDREQADKILARQDIPALLDEVERLEARVRQCLDVIAMADGAIDDAGSLGYSYEMSNSDIGDWERSREKFRDGYRALAADVEANP